MRKFVLVFMAAACCSVPVLFAKTKAKKIAAKDSAPVAKVETPSATVMPPEQLVGHRRRCPEGQVVNFGPDGHKPVCVPSAEKAPATPPKKKG